MKVDTYVRSLLPSFEKTRILEELRTAREELVDITIPAFKAGSEAFKTNKFKHRETQSWDKQFKNYLKENAYKNDYISSIYQILNRSLKVIDDIGVLVNKSYSNDVMADALSYIKANLLQYTEMLRFINTTSRRLLLLTYGLEASTVNKEADRDIFKSIDAKHVQKHLTNYIVALNILNRPVGEVEKSMKKIPDMDINPENVQNVRETVGASRIDPFGFGLIPVFMNPIFHVRMAIANWQAKQYKLAQEEKTQLELKLFHLKQSRSGKRDAKLEQNIEYTQDRIEKLAYKIHRMEEDDD
ncbi:hypothetical protein [Endozoicomonas sp. ONNA1]|uniref:hypothetical protein n=1 Tax=Endozoicomonas sp. ONNA1 TaxID=2828740 RepID=UPI002148FD2A|nr:hypothetical protein [Endozoicomonas sp. ONNA1]